MAQRPAEYWTTGRRKTAVARVRLRPGRGELRINKRTLDDYFSRETLRMVVNQPLDATDGQGAFDILANVQGGGVSAQAQAIRLGIARALVEVNPEAKPTLKKEGHLTRDSRAVERKKYGRHKARKSPQFSKR